MDSQLNLRYMGIMAIAMPDSIVVSIYKNIMRKVADNDPMKRIQAAARDSVA